MDGVARCMGICFRWFILHDLAKSRDAHVLDIPTAGVKSTFSSGTRKYGGDTDRIRS